MTLPSSGSISLGQVSTELGRSATQSLSMNDSAVRNLAGVGAGAISMSQLRGKSNITFNQAPGTHSANGRPGATFSITASQPCVWTYSKDNARITASPTSGGSSTTFACSLTATGTSPNFVTQQGTVTLTATYNGQSFNWTILLTGQGNNVNQN